jgi:hypothetical protein
MAGVIVWARVVAVGADGTRRVLVLTGEEPPGLAAVEALARLQLAARRGGGRILLQAASPALAELLGLAGLLREVGGQAEGREDAVGVQEGVDAGDAIG